MFDHTFSFSEYIYVMWFDFMPMEYLTKSIIQTHFYKIFYIENEAVLKNNI